MSAPKTNKRDNRKEGTQTPLAHHQHQQPLPTTTTIMNSFDFITSDVSDFTCDLYTEYDFSDIEFPLTTPEPQSPLTSADWDWLDAIPTHEPTTTEPPSSSSDDSSSESSATPEPDQMEYDPPHIHHQPALPIPAEECTPKPAFQYLPIEEVVNFPETWDFHRAFARSSLELHGVPRNLYERWEEFDHLGSNEIYRLIHYFQAFNPYEKLTDWQQQFCDDFKPIAAPPCIFCKLPKNYWCERVATNLF